jgi:hypothetical protein
LIGRKIFSEEYFLHCMMFGVICFSFFPKRNKEYFENFDTSSLGFYRGEIQKIKIKKIER